MLIISSVIIIGVACSIANAAYFAIFKCQPLQQVASVLTPEERLRRAYRSAYFMNVSLSNEAKNENGGSADDY